MGKIKQSTIYVLLFIIAFLVILSINKLLAMVLLLIVLCILIGKNLYLGKIIKVKIVDGKTWSMDGEVVDD